MGGGVHFETGFELLKGESGVGGGGVEGKT